MSTRAGFPPPTDPNEPGGSGQGWPYGGRSPQVTEPAAQDVLGSTGEPQRPGEPTGKSSRARLTRVSQARGVALAIGVTAAAVLGVGAASAWALQQGGGPQPEEALPANVVLYAEIDLNPGAGQKINAYRLGRKFPDLKLRGEDSIKDDLVRAILEEDEVADYERDFQPWVGDRLGVAMLNELDAFGEPRFAFAIEYTDRDAAQEGLTRSMADGEGGFAFGAEDYVILSDSVAAAEQVVAAAELGTLADRAGYVAAQDKLGGDRVATFWVDFGGLFGLFPDEIADELLLQEGFAPKGAIIVGASVKPDSIEIEGTEFGLDLGPFGGGLTTPTSDRTELLQAMPEDAFFALSIAGLDEAAEQLRSQLEEIAEVTGVREIEDFLLDLQAAGIRLPEDVQAILGKETALVVTPNRDPRPGTDPVAVGLRSRDGDPERGLEAVAELFAYLEGGSPQDYDFEGFLEVFRSGLVLGSTPEILDQVKGGGSLGDSVRFRDAVADPTAPLVAYLDLAYLLNEFRADLDISVRDAARVAALDSLGLSADEDSFTLRITVD